MKLRSLANNVVMSSLRAVSCTRHSRVFEVDKEIAYENIEIITRSHPDAFPSALRQKGKTQTKVHDTEDALVKVTEKCPECGHMEAYFKELQVRLPYTCPPILILMANTAPERG